MTTRMPAAYLSSDAAAMPDAIYVNGHVVTVDPRFSIAEAFATVGDRFVAVGSNAEIRKLAGSGTRLVDLEGRTVVPGFADSHLHTAGGGPGVDLSSTRSISDVVAAVAAWVKRVAPGELVVSNCDWHEAQLKEQRLPLRLDLDAVSPNNPVVLVRGGHQYILNSAALAKWRIDKSTVDPPGGRIGRYPDEEPNGELVDEARTPVTLLELYRPLPDATKLTVDQQIDFWAAQYRRLNEAGVTSVRHPGITIAEYHALQEMNRRGLLTVRLNVMFWAPPDPDAAKVRAFIENSAIKPGEGDDWLRVWGMKIMLDGGFEGGWMREPYNEPMGQGGKYRGIALVPRDRYVAVVKEINRLGWRLGTHASGDAAIDEVLTAYEAANTEHSIMGKRWAIEHGSLPTEADFARINALGVVVTVQNHLYLAGPVLVRYWGPKRAAWVTPVRAYLDHGVTVAAGTDSPVIPYSPLRTMYHFISRDTINGGVLGADQKITRAEALRISTVNNAYLTYQENTKGSIEPGRLADFVVLESDLLTVPEKQLESMKVAMTVVGGKTVFASPGAPAHAHNAQ